MLKELKKTMIIEIKKDGLTMFHQIKKINRKINILRNN